MNSVGGRRSGPRRKACSVRVSGVCENVNYQTGLNFSFQTRHDFFEGDWPTAACTYSFQAFLGKVANRFGTEVAGRPRNEAVHTAFSSRAMNLRK
jgi:hypothetical protein